MVRKGSFPPQGPAKRGRKPAFGGAVPPESIRLCVPSSCSRARLVRDLLSLANQIEGRHVSFPFYLTTESLIYQYVRFFFLFFYIIYGMQHMLV